MTGTDERATEITPDRASEPALVDLIDVLLTDGVVLRADVVITVADVPLIGIDLRAALSGMETMTEYGRMVEWDEELRARGGEPGLGEGSRYGFGMTPQPDDPMADEGRGPRYGAGRVPDPTKPVGAVGGERGERHYGVGRVPNPENPMEGVGEDGEDEGPRDVVGERPKPADPIDDVLGDENGSLSDVQDDEDENERDTESGR